MAIPSANTIISDLQLPKTLWKQPVILGIFGLPCAGKTSVAHYLAEQHPLLLLTTDWLRLKYGFASGPDTLAMMFEVADSLLPKQVSLVFDGIHPRTQNRTEIRTLAKQHAVCSHFLFVTADPDVINQRLRKRLMRPEETAAEGKFVIAPEHFKRLASYLEPPAAEETDVVIVDTTENKVEPQLSWLNKQLANGYL